MGICDWGSDVCSSGRGRPRFLAGWSGGPSDWFERGQCIMSLHRAFPITAGLADQWSAAMARAIKAQPGIDPQLAAAMADALGHMARGMINLSLDQNAA